MGDTYVKSVIVPGAKIFLVGEAPGEEENNTGEPFKGRAGRLLNRLLEEAGINRAEVSIGNVARIQPYKNDINTYFEGKRYSSPKPIMLKWLQELKQEIQESRPNIVVALGATAMWALTGELGMAANRGYIMKSSLVPEQKMLVTWHPQKVNYEWKLSFEVIMDLRKAKKNSLIPQMPKDSRALNAHPSKSEFMQYMEYILHDCKGPIATDIETTANCHPDIIGLADTPDSAMSLSILNSDRSPKFSIDGEQEVWRLYAQVLQEKQIIMQNGMFDAAVLMLHLGIYASGYYGDTMIAAHACYPEAKRSLSFLSSLCLNVPKWKHMAAMSPTLYNAEDCANTLGVWEVLEQDMNLLGVRHTHDFEMEQVWPAMLMQLQGVEVNSQRQQAMMKSIQQRVFELEDEIKTTVGNNKINLNSHQQLKKLLYEDMRLPIQYKRRKSKDEERKATTDRTALMKLYKISDNNVLNLLMDYKKAIKLLDFIDIPVSPEGKVHTCYNVTGATMLREKRGGIIVDDEDDYKSFGRWSSSSSIILPYGSGNNQNIPKTARTIYKAPRGEVFIQADYIQAEAVVVAYYIGDEVLKKMFRDSFGMSREERKAKGFDVHRMTAAQMFRCPPALVSDDQRRMGKTLRHATNYSAGPGVVANQLGCTMKEASSLLEIFHASCPQLRIWHKEIQRELSQTRTLTNLLGRKHKFLQRWDDNLFRSAYAYKPQSTVGDLLNLALVRMYKKYGHQMKLTLQLHDAAYITVEKSQALEAIEAMRECMLIPLNLYNEEFYIDVDFSVGEYWGEMTDL